MRARIRILLTLILVSPLISGQDSTWPQFRGPDSNPVASHPQLPERWSTTENVEWSVEIPGRGWSSPILADGKVLVTAAVTEGKSKSPQVGTEYSNEYIAELIKEGLSPEEADARVTARDFELPHEVMLHYFLYCVDIETGSLLWKREFYAGRPPGGRHRKNSFTSETPVTDGKLVYVYATNLGVYAYDLTGEQVWATPLKAYPIIYDFGTGASPVLHENRLIILADNEEQQFLAAYDKSNGELLWRTDRDIRAEGGDGRRSGWTTPYIWSNPQREEIVTVGPGTAVSYDLDGKELWRLNGTAMNPIPSPFAHGKLLYMDGGKTRPVFAIRPGASGDISLAKGEKANEYIAWSEARAGSYLPTPIAYEGGLYVLGETGILTRFDALTGKRSFKARLDREAGHFSSSPWAYNGKLFCLSEEGDTFVVNAGESFELLHVNSLEEMALATPAIVADRLLVRTQSRLYSIRRPAE